MNNSKVIVRLSFAKYSEYIRASITAKGNVTLTGSIEFSTDLDVEYYNSLCELSAENAIGSVGTLILKDNKATEKLISNINFIQKYRPLTANNTKYPFVWLQFSPDTIIFNKGLEGAPSRLAFLNIESEEVIIRKEAPLEVLQLINKVGVGNRDYYSRIPNTPNTVIAAREGMRVNNRSKTLV
jgi:hypothetical protein